MRSSSLRRRKTRLIDSSQNMRLVVDTSGLIHGNEDIFHRATIGQTENGSIFYIYTSPRVIQEVRDVRARKRLQELESVLIVREPNSSSLKAVVDFARRTGDYPHLSRVDIHVLSLTLMLELESSGRKFLKPEFIEHLPSGLGEPKENVPRSEPGQSKVEEETASSVKQVETAFADIQIKEEKDVAISSFDVWIHSENVDAIVQNSQKKSIQGEPSAQENRVGCMTSDFSMQNLLLQMGLILISPDGRRVKRLKSFVLQCESCFHVTKEVERLFCPHCGNHTLLRTTCKTDKQGNLLVFPPRRKKNNLRGTIFPIPKPQSGRNALNLILCEDQYIEKEQKLKNSRRKKAYRDVLDPATEYNASPFFQKEQPLIIGYNRKCAEQLQRKNKNGRKDRSIAQSPL
ncbi:RNA-binding protein NOB1 [Galdieria sulphuraria]|nr:RNA-binding protein NOB1 [Galdieria sulphuraria]